MRLTLVAIHPAPSPQAVPLANAFLQSYLEASPPAAGPIEIERADFFLHQESATCVDEIVTRQPAVVGFSVYVWNRKLCAEIAGELRLRQPGIIIFAGGPEATADPAGLLAEGGLDFLISGEGEKPFAEVCARLAVGADVAGIPGVVTLEKNGISLIPAQSLTDLDSIPSPWLNGILDAARYPGILWQLSRGCGFNCDFCFDSRDRHGVRHFSLERIEAELRHFACHGVSQVFVLDSTFNQDVRRAKTILRMIRKIAPHIHFHFEVRSEFLDREMAGLFAGITCSLQIGLQSADPQVLRRVGRSFRRDDFVRRTMLLNDTGAVFGFDLMYGLPGDTLSGFRDSLDFALGLYPNHLDIFPLAVLPGTALASRAASHGLDHLPVPPYTLTASPSFTSGDMAAARTLAMACDIFYTRGRAVAWFNGVIHPLAVSPSLFLQQFAEWLEQQPVACIDETGLSDEQIWQLQRAFLSWRFGTKKLGRLLPAVLDLLDYHYHYAAALLTPPPQIPSKKSMAGMRLLQIPLSLAPSARPAHFSYEILEILDAGAPDVLNFADTLEPCGSWAVIYPTAKGVRTESFDPSLYRLLEELDGRTAPSTLISDLGITAGDAGDFLAFAVSEGIVLIPSSATSNKIRCR